MELKETLYVGSAALIEEESANIAYEEIVIQASLDSSPSISTETIDEISYVSATISSIGGDFSASIEEECLLLGSIAEGVSNEPKYKGTYEAISKPFEDYSLPTKNYLMESDIIVKKIPTYETSNNFGTTINIGG